MPMELSFYSWLMSEIHHIWQPVMLGHCSSGAIPHESVTVDSCCIANWGWGALAEAQLRTPSAHLIQSAGR